MAGKDTLRARLETLTRELAAKAPPPTADRADPAPEPREPSPGPLDELLRVIQEEVDAAADGAETFIADHPLGAVAAAFVLGVAVGRLSTSWRT